MADSQIILELVFLHIRGGWSLKPGLEYVIFLIIVCLRKNYRSGAGLSAH